MDGESAAGALATSDAFGLTEDVVARLTSAASTMRLTPNEFVRVLLQTFYSTLRGLTPQVLFYIFTYLDYSTISSMVSLVCREWQEDVRRGEPARFFAGLRQVHGVHVVDPVRGVFYLPRALKRVLVMASGADVIGAKGGAAAAPAPPPPPPPPPVSSEAAADARLPAESREMAAPASSFLTVNIRTQDPRSLPWTSVRGVVQRAIDAEKVAHGEVRTAGLQRPEDPALTQPAVATHDRRVYVFGGESFEGIVLSRCYEYDPFKKRWGALPQLREARAAACAVAFGGRIYVFGGYNQAGEVLDTYEVFDVRTSRWLNPVVANGSRGFRMPERACGIAVAAYEDVLLLVGGCRTRLRPDDTAFLYSGGNSAATSPRHGFPSTASLLSVPSVLATPSGLVSASGGGGGGSAREWFSNLGGVPVSGRSPADGADLTSSPATTTGATVGNSPPAHSLSRDGPIGAENWAWVFSPREHTWSIDGPALPSDRAFGSMVVLDLPSLGACLCYFGGCARADKPETAMLYTPLAIDPQDRDVTKRGQSSGALEEEEGKDEGRTTPDHQPQPRCVRSKAAGGNAGPGAVFDPALARYFREDLGAPGNRCEWQRHTRVPLGGAFTSAAVLGSADSRTVVLSSFYPAPFIGYCKVRDLVPAMVAERLSHVLSPREPVLQEGAAASGSSSPVLGPWASTPPPTRALLGAGDGEESDSSLSSPPVPTGGGSGASPPAPLDAGLQENAIAAAAEQRSRDIDSSHQQRREMRHLMGVAASAASHKRPLAPRTAGEERKWSLAPMAEVQVRDNSGRPLLNRVSWKTQSINGKLIVGIE